MTPLVGWLIVAFSVSVFIHQVLWLFSSKFRSRQYRNGEQRLRLAPSMRVLTRCRALMPVIAANFLLMSFLLLVDTKGLTEPNISDVSPGVKTWLVPAMGLSLLVMCVTGGLCGLNYLFNWPKFFVPKEYRGDRGLFVSDKRDLEEANILRAEALEAIESAPPKPRKRKRRK